ncbi:serine hydrolase domain-containing protein [Aminobacter aminovorans]|uniref:serine hydrolase domain-containing protein n=1 Tax=Aminobacter aminovorans TaxID=83263 RepID=UPI00285DCFDE|nr:serine hydrolase domain-containing protein [Aminobacter aminovorans]MDR7221241.1 CubicO group peptidase (beta-lactamase class C family) [Aminobacter aminovorans]
MRDELTAWLKQTGAPGVSVAIDDGRDITCFSHGVADLRTRTPVSEETAFQLGSVSKVVTAFVLLETLAERGISVDTPVVDLAPDLEASNERAFHDITVRHLLSHTSGLDSQWWVDLGRGDCARRQAARAIAATPLIARPGELFSYSGPAFVLAGYLVDLLAGTCWEEAVRDTVARHLGDHSISARPEDVLLRPSATGYRKSGGASDAPFAATRWYAPLALSPGGGLVATPLDLTRLMTPLRQRLGLEPLHADHQLTPTIGWRYESWGLGMARYRLADGALAWGHDGTTSGQACAVRLADGGPETVVVSTNAVWAASAAGQLAETILTRLRNGTGHATIKPRRDALEAYGAWRLPSNAELSGRYLRLNSTILVRPVSSDELAVDELSSPQDEANWFGQKTPHGAAGTTDMLRKVGTHSYMSATREFHFLRHPDDPARQYIHNGMRASVKAHRPWM